MSNMSLAAWTTTRQRCETSKPIFCRRYIIPRLQWTATTVPKSITICTDKKQDGHCWPSCPCCFSFHRLVGIARRFATARWRWALDPLLKVHFVIVGLWHIFVLTLKSQCHALPRQSQHLNPSIASRYKKSIIL